MSDETVGHRVTIRDVRALSALAHPLRLRLLHYLMASGPRTASQCAAAVHDSPSNCSYHLRELARHDLLERAEPGADTDGRERPWQATATGFDFEPGDAAGRAANAALQSAAVDETVRLLREYLAGQDELDEQWREAATLSNYGLLLTAGELADLTSALDAAIRPYIAATRTEAPPDARPVNVNLHAFLHPDTG